MIEKELWEEIWKRLSVALVPNWQKIQCQEDFLHCQKRKTDTTIQFHQYFKSNSFLYKSVFHCFHAITVWICNIFGVEKISQKLLLNCWWNWQHGSISLTLLRRAQKHQDTAFGIKSALHWGLGIRTKLVSLFGYRDPWD